MAASPAPLVQEYRALLLLPDLPTGRLAHPVTDTRSAPHLHPGEFAVVDTADRAPQQGELYLIAYQDPREPDGRVLRVVQVLRRRIRVLVEGEPVDDLRWFAIPYDRSGSSEGAFRPGQIERKLVGRIIGILAPAFEEPRRLPVGRGSRR